MLQLMKKSSDILCSVCVLHFRQTSSDNRGTMGPQEQADMAEDVTNKQMSKAKSVPSEARDNNAFIWSQDALRTDDDHEKPW